MTRGTLWYVFPGMENVVKNISDIADKGDLLLISQNFPTITSEFVGKDVIPNPGSIIKWFSGYFNPVKTIFMEDRLTKGSDNWLIARLRRK